MPSLSLLERFNESFKHQGQVFKFFLLALSSISIRKDTKVTHFGCVDSEEETPVPIPNTEVKLLCGDGTAVLTVGE